jgi:hypothetical protein
VSVVLIWGDRLTSVPPTAKTRDELMLHVGRVEKISFVGSISVS